MKAIVVMPTEIEVSKVIIDIPVRYEDEDIPFDFPLRQGDRWRAEVMIDSGHIDGWPEGREAEMHMKVVDEGYYQLIDPEGNVIATRSNDYVPHGVVPGEYGDYVHLVISGDGVIQNWPEFPDLSVFFEREE